MQESRLLEPSIKWYESADYVSTRQSATTVRNSHLSSFDKETVTNYRVTMSNQFASSSVVNSLIFLPPCSSTTMMSSTRTPTRPGQKTDGSIVKVIPTSSGV